MPNVSLYCALDTRDRSTAEGLAQRLAPAVGGLKLGLEYFCAHGPDGIAAVHGAGLPLFLDLKLHDIPNTVAGAVRSVAALQPHYLTVHTAGGIAMMRAAREAAEEEAARRGVAPPNLLGVTVLTSLDDSELARQGVTATAREQVLRLAGLAHEAGLAGVIASPHEIAALRSEHGADFHIVVPGIRPASGGGSGKGDQARVATPADAARAGATALVVGRPITRAPDPLAAARAIVREVADAS
ncbi:MAG: orotidine-5'-phosphate decarboxylase [Rhodospirillales bacterium]|nr:orotidine-5'-phosphate decarboxylase [Rhodospirillales bacterium]